MKTNMLITVSMLLIILTACNIASNIPPAKNPISVLPETTVRIEPTNPAPEATPESTTPSQIIQEVPMEPTEPVQPYPNKITEPIVPAEAYPSTIDTKEELSAYPPAVEGTAEIVSDKPILHTEFGELLITSSRLVSEVNHVTAGPNEKILLIVLSKPNQAALTPEDIPLEAFNDKRELVYLLAENEFTANTMSGWIDDEEAFAIGFPVPNSTETYKLIWGENEPVDIFPTE